MRLVTTVPVPTDGDTPFLVSWTPCTIHGCRPLSVSSQPEVFMANGSTTAQIAARWNHFAVASFRRRSTHRPHTASSATTVPPYAITRIDQYWMKTLGT